MIKLTKKRKPRKGIIHGANNQLTETIPFYENGSIESIQISLDIEHPSMGDIIAKVINPEGIEVYLHNRVDVETNTLRTVFDSSILAPFIGKDVKGDWTLLIEDQVAKNEGILYSWSIGIDYLQIESTEKESDSIQNTVAGPVVEAEAPAETEVVAEEAVEVEAEAPAETEVVAEEAVEVEAEAPAEAEVVAEEAVEVEAEAPAEAEVVAEEAVEVEAEAPAEAEVVAEEAVEVEAEAPAEAEVVAEEAVEVEAEAPAEAEVVAEEAVDVEAEAPAEAEVVAEEAVEVEAEASAEAEVVAEEAVEVEAEAPAEAEVVAEEAVEVEAEAPAEAEVVAEEAVEVEAEAPAEAEVVAEEAVEVKAEAPAEAEVVAEEAPSEVEETVEASVLDQIKEEAKSENSAIVPMNNEALMSMLGGSKVNLGKISTSVDKDGNIFLELIKPD